MTVDEDFAQFEDEDAAPTPAKKKAPAKRAPRKAAAKRAPKKAPKNEPEEPKVDEEAAEKRAAEVDAADDPEDDGTVEVVITRTVSQPVVHEKSGLPVIRDGKILEEDVEVEFRTRIPTSTGDWDGKVLWLFSKGRDIEACNRLLGDVDFERYLDVIEPKQSEVSDKLLSAFNKALGIAQPGN